MIRQDTGFDQESFLVEARSIGGYSGSPVFLFIPAMSSRENVENWYPPSLVEWKSGVKYGSLMSHGPWLLGVTWCAQVKKYPPPSRALLTEAVVNQPWLSAL